MEGLKKASNAITKATKDLVKAAQESIQEEPATKMDKPDIFKEVSLIIFSYFFSYFIQRIDAEARVLKLEKELRDAKKLEQQLSQTPQRSVGDIKRVDIL